MFERSELHFLGWGSDKNKIYNTDEIWRIAKEGFGMEYKIGDIVEFKKPHPCGSKQWEITRTGVDFKFKCKGCGHVIILQRQEALKKIIKKVNANEKK